MKNLYCKVGILLMGCALMTIDVKAQEVDTTYAARMDYIFKYIDKNKIPYGLLKDAALEMADLSYYNGNSLSDSNVVFTRTWDDIYLTLATAQMNASAAAAIVHPDAVDSVWFAKRQSRQVTLAGLYFKYGYIANDAATKVNIVNDQVYDKYINGVWQNPYASESVLAFAPACIEFAGLAFAFRLPAELWLSNQKNQVVKIELDAQDGQGYRSLLADVPLPVVYADSGLKELKFKVWLSDNTVLQSHTLLHISNSPYVYISTELQQPNQGVKGGNTSSVLPSNCISGNADANGIEMIKMTSEESFGNAKAIGLITVKYAQADHKIHKPFIVVEGFDPGIYSIPEDISGENNFENFKTSLEYLGQIEDILVKIPQYDLIYIDWKDGTADMRLNALLLKTVIRCVNQEKVADANGMKEKNVIIGQSMGGVIARYALKKMEDAGEDHDTRLFISHDAPHQGADVPLGIQALAVHAQHLAVRARGAQLIYSIFKGQSYKELLLANSPAAKQLLTNRLDYNYQQDNTVYTQWQTELKNLGYPQNCRNIAISNGSECGTHFPLAPSENIVFLDGYYKTKLLGDLFMAPVALPMLGALIGQLELTFLGVIPGNHKISFHFESNTVSDLGG